MVRITDATVLHVQENWDIIIIIIIIIIIVHIYIYITHKCFPIKIHGEQVN